MSIILIITMFPKLVISILEKKNKKKDPKHAVSIGFALLNKDKPKPISKHSRELDIRWVRTERCYRCRKQFYNNSPTVTNESFVAEQNLQQAQLKTTPLTISFQHVTPFL